MRGFFFSVPTVAGACNSFRKQNNSNTKLTAQQLTERGFDNIQKCFITLLAGAGMSWTGGIGVFCASAMQSGIMSSGVIGLSLMTTFAGSTIVPIYGAFKAGEGAADLWQSPPPTFRSGVNSP